jgi:hypothetical protein
VDGDYRFNERSLAGVILLVAGFLLLSWLLRKLGAPALRFFILFAFLTGGVVVLWTARMYVVPQPHRYQIAMDMALCLSVIFTGAELLKSKPRLLWGAGITLFLLTAIGIRYNVRYARTLIRPIDVTTTSTYKIARWLDGHFGDQRVMVPGSYALYINNFTDTPQVLGGHDPMQANPLMRIVGFVLYSGMNAGTRDGEISAIWLKALGVHAVVVSGPQSGEYYKPFANPLKFDGLLPVLLRDAGDTIYAVPARSSSLAHVVPVEALVSHLPIHGLDVDETERYLKALDDPSLSEAELVWTNRHSAAIHAQVQPGQAISVQVTYTPGWRAEANGSPLRVEKDGLGLIKLAPKCQGACEVTLIYDGGTELRLTLAASLITMAGVVAAFLIGFPRSLPRRSLDPH